MSACQAVPTRFDHVERGRWSGRVLITDRIKDKSQVVQMNINAVKGQKMRADLSSSLGHHLASLVVQGDQLSYILVPEKKFVTGPATIGGMRTVLSIPLDPKVLDNVLFDIPIENKNWSCTKDKRGDLAECKSPADSIVIRWMARDEGRKTVKIEHPQAVIQFSFSGFSPELDKREALFELSAPKGFRVQKLN